MSPDDCKGQPDGDQTVIYLHIQLINNRVSCEFDWPFHVDFCKYNPFEWRLSLPDFSFYCCKKPFFSFSFIYCNLILTTLCQMARSRMGLFGYKAGVFSGITSCFYLMGERNPWNQSRKVKFRVYISVKHTNLHIICLDLLSQSCSFFCFCYYSSNVNCTTSSNLTTFWCFLDELTISVILQCVLGRSGDHFSKFKVLYGDRLMWHSYAMLLSKD